MKSLEIIKEAEKLFINSNYDAAFNLYQKITLTNLKIDKRFNVLCRLCEIYKYRKDIKSFKNNLDELQSVFNKYETSESKERSTFFKFFRELNALNTSFYELRKEIEIEEAKKHPIQKLNLIAIGYWKSEYEPNYPHPQQLQDESWNKDEKQLVIDHLRNSITAILYKGFSWCRFNCGENDMGTKCLTDGIYIFPEKLYHYLESHDVRLPNKFVEHVKNYKPIQEIDFEVGNIDYTWWEKVK